MTRRATLARILRMPSVDWTEQEGMLVRDVLPRKRQHPGYADVLASMRAGIPPLPVEFRHDPGPAGQPASRLAD